MTPTSGIDKEITTYELYIVSRIVDLRSINYLSVYLCTR